MKCPNCGRQMEDGYLTVPLHYGMHSMKWSAAPEHSILSDDIIYDPKKDPDLSLFGSGSALPASRCRFCACVVFFYEPQGRREDLGERNCDPDWRSRL